MVNGTSSIQAIDMLAKQQMPYEVSMGDGRQEQQIEYVAREFESIFIEQILKQVDRTMDYEDNILYAGHAENIVRGMYNQQLARSMTDNGGFGVADMIRAELLARTAAVEKE